MPISRIEFRVETTQQWVGADERDPNDEDGIRLLGAGPSGVVEILYNDIPGNSWNQNRLNKFAGKAQEFLDSRTPLTDLPIDDPDRTIDPALPNLFWDGSDLVCRMILLSDVRFEDNTLLFTLTEVK